MLKTPQFWTKNTAISWLLLPFSIIYFASHLIINFLRKKNKISKPVICVGNLIAGGSGKTPVAIAVGKILNEMTVDFAYLSRGYMGDGSKFLLLSKNNKNNAKEVGDEPMLLVETAPTFVAIDRILGARELERMKRFSAVILDDGMQNDSLHKDFTILVVDGKIGFGNEFMIPAGPMREPFSYGIKKSDIVVVVGEAKAGLLQKFEGKKLFRANIKVSNSAQFADQKLIAFCGLAYPQKFFSLLEKEGLNLIETKSFADHYIYKKDDLEQLCEIAKKENATLITTKKDWVKFAPNFREKIAYLDIELEFENKDLLKNELKKYL